jgi:hypothetical protein
MEKWDKGVQMLQTAPSPDKELLDKLSLIREYNAHRARGENLLKIGWRPRPIQVKALELVKDPVTGAYGLPGEGKDDDK